MGNFVDGYETIDLEQKDPYPHTSWQIHMKAKGRWQILKWGKQHGDWGYKVVSEYPTHKQALAILILMENEDGTA